MGLSDEVVGLHLQALWRFLKGPGLHARACMANVLGVRAQAQNSLFLKCRLQGRPVHIACLSVSCLTSFRQLNSITVNRQLDDSVLFLVKTFLSFLKNY